VWRRGAADEERRARRCAPGTAVARLTREYAIVVLFVVVVRVLVRAADNF